MGESEMAGALDGIRVLELARYQAGPRGGMILSDLGAEVIKLEKIGGEETRKWSVREFKFGRTMSTACIVDDVLYISELTGMEGTAITMQDLFIFERQGYDEKKKLRGRFKATGIRPKFSEKLAASGILLSFINRLNHCGKAAPSRNWASWFGDFGAPTAHLDTATMAERSPPSPCEARAGRGLG